MSENCLLQGAFWYEFAGLLGLTHVIQIASGNISTLHYYVKSIGGTYREANFLRIFHIQYSKRDQEDRNLLLDSADPEVCQWPAVRNK